MVSEVLPEACIQCVPEYHCIFTVGQPAAAQFLVNSPYGKPQRGNQPDGDASCPISNCRSGFRVQQRNCRADPITVPRQETENLHQSDLAVRYADPFRPQLLNSDSAASPIQDPSVVIHPNDTVRSCDCLYTEAMKTPLPDIIWGALLNRAADLAPEECDRENDCSSCVQIYCPL